MSAKLSKAQQEVMDLINNYTEPTRNIKAVPDNWNYQTQTLKSTNPNIGTIFSLYKVASVSTLRALENKGLIVLYVPSGSWSYYVAPIQTETFVSAEGQAKSILVLLDIHNIDDACKHIIQACENSDSAIVDKVVDGLIDQIASRYLDKVIRESQQLDPMRGINREINRIKDTIRKLTDKPQISKLIVRLKKVREQNCVGLIESYAQAIVNDGSVDDLTIKTLNRITFQAHALGVIIGKYEANLRAKENNQK